MDSRLLGRVLTADPRWSLLKDVPSVTSAASLNADDLNRIIVFLQEPTPDELVGSSLFAPRYSLFARAARSSLEEREASGGKEAH